MRNHLQLQLTLSRTPIRKAGLGTTISMAEGCARRPFYLGEGED